MRPTPVGAMAILTETYSLRIMGTRPKFEPEVPVIVQLVRSKESEEELVRVTVEEPVAGIVAGLKTGTTSESHEPDSAICPLKPKVAVGVTVYAALPPAATVWSEGVAVIVNPPFAAKFAVSDAGAFIVIESGDPPFAVPVKFVNW
jgi:hypothetical protein